MLQNMTAPPPLGAPQDFGTRTNQVVRVSSREAEKRLIGERPTRPASLHRKTRLDQALRKALRGFYPSLTEVRLTDYKVRIIDSTRGTEAKTRVLISSTDGKNTWNTVGVSDNILDASWLALAESIEFFLLRREMAAVP